MLFEIEAIDAMNKAEYSKDIADDAVGTKAWYMYNELCCDLNRFPVDSSLRSMLPPGYCMISYVDGRVCYAIYLRCLIDGDWVDLRLHHDPDYNEMFHVLETTKEINVPYHIVTLEDIARVLERHMPEIREWQKSHRS